MSWWNFKQNVMEYNEAEKNPIVIRGNKVSTKEMRDKYFEHYNIPYFKRFFYQLPLNDIVIVLENDGYWLNEIIILNLDKEYEFIRRIIFGNEKYKIKTLEIDDEAAIIKINKKKSEIKKYLKLPTHLGD